MPSALRIAILSPLILALLAPGAVATPRTATSAFAATNRLTVKGRAPMTGYARDQFGSGWVDVDHNGCDTRDDILRRDLRSVALRPGTHGCVVVAGSLADPYTATSISYVRGGGASVDIDHVVALGDAWQKGAQRWPFAKRVALADDPLNLLAVSASANRQKGDADTATWLPQNRTFRCPYVARQVAVKLKYGLWVTAAEQAAMRRVLGACPTLALPAPGSSPVVARTSATPPDPTPTRPSGSAGGSHCQPSYTGYCVPIVSGDLNCSDIRHEVRVVGDDPYKLDQDHDGRACESYGP